MKEEETVEKLRSLVIQKQRWVGTNHPDSKIRELAFKISGIDIGKDTFISIGMVIIDAYENLIKIGDRCAFGNNVSLIAASGPNNSKLMDIPAIKEKYLEHGPINIGNDSWIGSNTTILPNVSIGSYSIISAGAVVNRNVPSFSVFAGVPAKLVRKLERK